jgi:hypothetical protein
MWRLVSRLATDLEVRMRLRLVVLLLVLGASAALAQSTLPESVRQEAAKITADQLGRDLEFLASDALLGRNTPSPGFDAAADYIAKRLKQAGLEPMGDGSTFFQRYEMRESRVKTDEAAMEIDGRRFRFGDDFVIRSFAKEVSGRYRAVYVGHGWTVPDRGIDPYKGLDVRGKVVVAHGPRALPKGVDIPQLGRVSVGATPVIAEAERRGAAAVIVIPQTAALKDWDAGRTQNLTRRELEPWVASAYAAPPVTSLMLASAATDALFAGERVAGAEVRKLGDTADYPPSFELSKSIRVQVSADSTSYHPFNVVAGIEGTDPALRNEYITIQSHLDGAVGTRTVDGDAIYNAADDNASGSAATLAMAERLMHARPKRSLIFIWDSGEERGLWGTRYFVHKPPVPLDRVVAHFNIDMIGASRAPGSIDASAAGVTAPDEVYLVGPGVLSGEADALVERVNRDYLNLRFNRAYDTPTSEFFYPRTDAGPFLERGILTIGFFTGLHPRYHQPADEARHLDPKKMEAITRTVFACVWSLASSPARPRIDKPIPATVPRYGRTSGG